MLSMTASSFRYTITFLNNLKNTYAVKIKFSVIKSIDTNINLYYVMSMRLNFTSDSHTFTVSVSGHSFCLRINK